MQWNDDSERELLGQLESELGTAELSAVLSEWVMATTHRICAVGAVLGVWREQLISHGWSDRAADASLPLIMARLWAPPPEHRSPLSFDEIMDLISDQIEETLDAEENDDDD